MSNSTDIANVPIGVIDSGIGGITVLRELLRACPGEHFIYIGDDANSPYGTRTAEEIQQLSLNLIRHPKLEGIKALVVACNTITACALDVIEQNFEGEVVGVIEPGVEAALANTKNNKVGILATTATVESQVFDNAFKAQNPQIELTSVGAPKLHEYAENNLDLILNAPTSEIKQCVVDHMKPFIDAGCDTILLACTHFPPYENLIRDIVGPDVNIIAPSINTAETLRTILEANNLTNELTSSQANQTPTNQTPNSANQTSENPNFEIISTAGNDEKYAKFTELLLK